MGFPAQDVATVRDLARRAAALASSDTYEARRRRWRDVNERRRPDRAPVWCRPAGMWPEVLPEESLQCTDPLCRRVEYTLRQHLYKDWVGDDHIFPPWWEVSAVWRISTEHVWGLPTGRQVESTELGGFRYEHAVQTVEDYARVTVPAFTYDAEATDRAVNRMGELLGEAMPVRLTCEPPLAPHQNTYLEQLRGMEPMLHDLAFRPWVVHRAMATLTEGVFAALRAAEATGLLTTNHHRPMTCSDPIGEESRSRGVEESKPDTAEPPPAVRDPRPETRTPVGLHNLWAEANSQEFQVVSPRMTEEFLLHYQIPVFQQYGAVQYGCCEDLTHKIEAVLRIPNLRTFVSSYWTDLDKVIAACGTRYTIMWRQHAASVTLADDLGPTRQHLEQGLRKLQGHHYQIVLRELQTLAGHPDRLREWTRLAIELAGKYA
jgi:hypothetical protein